MRNRWTYPTYLREATFGMLTAWKRLGLYFDWPAIKEAIAVVIVCLILLVTPFLFWLSPIVGLLSRASDRRDAREAAKNAGVVRRGRLHLWDKERGNG